MYCVDTWTGGEEHVASEMPEVEKRFKANTHLALNECQERVKLFSRKGFSSVVLPQLLTEGHASSFDIVYVDGSHQAPDVLLDMVLAYQLCKVNGLIICDDYVWRIGEVLHEPKIAIDAFVNIYRNKVSLISAPLVQLYLLKTS